MPLFRRKPTPPKRNVPPQTTAGVDSANDDLDWLGFDDVAEQYARVQAPQHAAVAADLVQLLEMKQGARVLDVGSGTGAAARAAAHAGGPDGLVIGVDPSVPMLQQARREGQARYAAARAIDLPFRDATFAGATACFVLGALPNYRTALFEILRVIAPGGRFGTATWAPGDDQDEFSRTWREAAEQFAEHEMMREARDRALPWEDLFSDRDRAKDALHEAGLRDIWVEKRNYRFATNRSDYLASREVTAQGRFLRHMLGDEFWGTFRGRVEALFAERFPENFNDFREAVLIVGHKP